MDIIDLSHPLQPSMPYYPGDEPPSFTPVTSIDSHGYRSLQVTLTTHTGTHIDAPAHCLSEGKTLDQFPASHFTGPARVVDCRHVRGIISLSHVRTNHEQLPTEFILILTGWDRYWGEEGYFTGFPVLSQEAACWLAAQAIKGIGIDAPSIDAPDETDLPNHRHLLAKGMVIIENLTHLDTLPHSLCRLYCLPLLIGEADAAPARVIACC